MSYQVLALKYRPQTFDDVVGQTHVTQTLTNAISSDRVAHAILFTGPRGTGKTTIARILAKAMNCKTGPTPSPCNRCDICKDIIDGHCTDVFEIDGASNNSVDQIRDLRENVTYMPSSAKYKIYIIDEVHMLSTAAFNALLKTLEEPPDHVMFIFATTEVHKIPATILSRCQRHDLSRINLELIKQHLKNLATAENFSLEDTSFDLIAQEADGSIRDSLSLLDRVLSSSDTNTISHESIKNSLGLLDSQIMHDLANAIFNKDGTAIINLLEQVDASGTDLKKFFSDLILYFRDLSIIKLCGPQNPAVNLSDNEKTKLSQLVAPFSGQFLSQILQTFLDDESLVRYSSHTKTAIEMILLKLLRINPNEQIDQIIENLDRLANQMSGPMPPQYDTPHPSFTETSSQVNLKNNELPEVRENINPPAGPGLTEKPQTNHENQDTQDSSFPRTWQGFLQKIEKSLPFMFALLSKGNITTDDENQISVVLKNCSSFDKKRIKDKTAILQKSCKEFLGKTLSIDILSTSPVNEQTEQKKNEKKAKQAAFNHPFVVEAQKMFNGEIINY